MSKTFVTPWTVAHQASLSMGFPRQEYWSGLPFPFPGDLPDPEVEPISPALAGRFFSLSHQGNPCAESLQLCPTLCNPMDCSLPGSSIHGILQASILEWVAMPSFRGSSRPHGSTLHLLCPLHWQVGSLPLAPPAKPKRYIPRHNYLISCFIHYIPVYLVSFIVQYILFQAFRSIVLREVHRLHRTAHQLMAQKTL